MPDDDEKNEDKVTRMDAAKAFFRAMYAGDESASAESSQADAESPPANSSRARDLEQQNKELEQRAIEAENLYKRMAADFDNFRRRMEREREEFANVGVRKAAEAIMPALDDLDRALLYLSPDTSADKIIESFQLVANRIIQCLEQAGLKRLSTKGEQFNPRFHEPVQQIETTEHPDGTIVHELRGGYTLGDKVIRPALVNVALNNTITIDPLKVTEKPGGPTDRSSSADPSRQTELSNAEIFQDTSTAATTDDKAATASSTDPDDKVYVLDDL